MDITRERTNFQEEEERNILLDTPKGNVNELSRSGVSNSVPAVPN